MANEISISMQLSFTKSGISDTMTFPSTKFTMSGTNYLHRTQTISTSFTALDVGNLTTPGFICIKNIGPTNFLTLKTASGGAVFGKLKVGECALFRWDTTCTAPGAIADTSSVQVEYLIIED